ncbi:MAG TPA: ATP-binding cassette domain-containing protein [Myxococcaceae bacterium]|nr:ATP-binding cassette domain-containing protein [Myxococcaceae bacterium]
MMQVEHLQKRFGTVTAVEDVSFEAADGQVTGLLGPNGAGKTTTLRILYTLARPDGGDARVDGVGVLSDPTEVRRRIGVLPDGKGLSPRLTAREHVRYFAALHGLSGLVLEKRVDALFERLEMRQFSERPAQGFSQGERMKVCVARALVHDPKNILLDEPTNGLDVMSIRGMRELIRGLKEDGRCVLLSSHVMQEVGALCDRIVVVARGRVVADQTPDGLIQLTGARSLEDAFVAAVALPPFEAT